MSIVFLVQKKLKILSMTKKYVLTLLKAGVLQGFEILFQPFLLKAKFNHNIIESNSSTLETILGFIIVGIS